MSPRRAVWKYLIFPRPDQGEFDIPTGSVFVHAGIDPGGSGAVAIWLEVEPDRPKFKRKFQAFCTGVALDSRYWTYRATVVSRDIALHVYEETKT